jgi:hypothetical protein
MSRVRIAAVPAQSAHGYKWVWASQDGRERSSMAFEMYYDCLSDARSRGHEVEPRLADPNTDPLRLHGGEGSGGPRS